jgi:acyl phosphate:glycerol-3-phosphate acyltransferase
MTRIIVVIVAYLIGSIPFGYLIVRGKIGADIRETGSGGTGATNVSRRAGKAAGVITLVLDALKGSAAVLIAARLTHSDWLVAAAAIAVLVGHIFPVWLGFRGGKGVATGAGVFLVLAPFALLCAGVLFLTIVVSTRYVSLGSMIAAAMIPVLIWLQSDSRPLLIAAVAGALLIVFAHRGNIERLAQGTESRI